MHKEKKVNNFFVLFPPLLLFVFFNTFCSNGVNSSGEASALTTGGVKPADGNSGKSQNYRVTLVSNWNKEDHLKVPGSAHFSRVTVVNHKSTYTLIPFQGKATVGLERLAELGKTGDIEREFKKEVEKGSIASYNIFAAMYLSKRTSMKFTISVTAEAPYFSMVSMIAPSPDWIIGVDALKLYDEKSGFLSGVERQALYAISGGTEGKDTAGNFTISDNAPDPIGYIKSLQDMEGFKAPFAYVTIEKIP